MAGMDARPGPNARVVGRGRISAVPIWLLIALVGLSGLVLGGIAMKLIVGLPFTLLALFGLATLIRSRVWVDGPTLYSRRLDKYGPPIRLDRLRYAQLSGFGPNQGRSLELVDRDGTRLRLDATNLRLKRLYAAMAPFVDPNDGIANDLLQRRMEPFRSGLPSGRSQPGPSGRT
jgi:hypothetical protein